MVEPRPDGGRSSATVRAWPSHRPILCQMNVAAAAVIYEAMGCEGVTVSRLDCVERGGDRCCYRVEWKEG